MQKAFIDFQHCRLVAFTWFTLLLLFSTALVAQTTDTQRTVVLVSLMEQPSAPYWSRGEKRITSELKMSDVNVISYAGSPFAAMNMAEELKNAAQSQQVNIAFFLYKTSVQNVRLMIYAKSTSNNTQDYTTYDFQLDATEESEDIVALKAAEAVLAVMKIQTDAPKASPNSAESNTSPGTKLALTLAISGVVSLGVGLGFHVQKHIYEQKATDLSNQMKEAHTLRLPPDLDALKSDYDASLKKTKAMRAGAIVGYALGGALLTVSAIILSYRRLHARKKASASISLQGTGVIWEF